MTPLGTEQGHSGSPYPKYLIDQESRTLIEALEDVGCTVNLTAPAPGSVSVEITTSGGQQHAEIGRPIDLADTIRLVAKECGLDLAG